MIRADCHDIYNVQCMQVTVQNGNKVKVAESAWDNPFLNRKIFLFRYSIFILDFFLSLTSPIWLLDFYLIAQWENLITK